MDLNLQAKQISMSIACDHSFCNVHCVVKHIHADTYFCTGMVLSTPLCVCDYTSCVDVSICVYHFKKCPLIRIRNFVNGDPR